MRIELTDIELAQLNRQSIERTAERLSYNANDILKIAVHHDVFMQDNVDGFRCGGLKITDPPFGKGYNAEVKLALAHILVSCFVLADQIKVGETGLNQLVKDTIDDHDGEW